VGRDCPFLGKGLGIAPGDGFQDGSDLYGVLGVLAPLGHAALGLLGRDRLGCRFLPNSPRGVKALRRMAVR
jgi:hypothetical protein